MRLKIRVSLRVCRKQHRTLNVFFRRRCGPIREDLVCLDSTSPKPFIPFFMRALKPLVLFKGLLRPSLCRVLNTGSFRRRNEACRDECSFWSFAVVVLRYVTAFWHE